MNNEFQILKNIEKCNTVTQRDISKNTGMSLGNVNILIRRLIKKGLIKMERITPGTIRYILTPNGMKEKADATYRYIVSSCKFINDVNTKMDSLLENIDFTRVNQVLLFGAHDEISMLLQNKLSHRKIQFKHIHTIEDIENDAGYKNCKSVIIIWHPDYSEILEEKNICFYSFLDEM